MGFSFFFFFLFAKIQNNTVYSYLPLSLFGVFLICHRSFLFVFLSKTFPVALLTLEEIWVSSAHSSRQASRSPPLCRVAMEEEHLFLGPRQGILQAAVHLSSEEGAGEQDTCAFSPEVWWGSLQGFLTFARKDCVRSSVVWCTCKSAL